MAWVLKYDGSNDRCDLSSEITLSGDFRIVIENFRYITLPTGSDIGGVAGSSNAYFNFSPCARPNVGGWQFRINNNSYNISDSLIPIPTTHVNYEFKRVGSTATVTIGGNSHQLSVSGSNYIFGTIGTLNAQSSPSSHHGNIEHGNISVYDSSDTLIYYYDVDNSDHSGSTNQPILTDTVGGNDATGVNFPSFDASVWDDLGGGGSINVSGSLTIPAPTLIGNLTKTNPSFDSSGSVVISKPVSSGQLSSIPPQFNTSISVTIPKPQLSAIGNNTKPNFDSSASITIPPPVVAGNISNGVGVISLNGNVTVSKPLLGGSLSKSNPQFNTAGSLLIAKPALTGVLSNSVPLVDLSGSVSISKPLASGGLSKSEPIFNASGSITISKPQITGNLVNGTINITFNAETNYNQPYLTSNFSQPNQSTVYVQPYKSTNRSQ